MKHAYFINPSHHSVRLYVYVPRQQLGKNITAAMNTRAKTEELLDASFYMRSNIVSMERRLLVLP
jgi:hypothetical protein